MSSVTRQPHESNSNSPSPGYTPISSPPLVVTITSSQAEALSSLVRALELTKNNLRHHRSSTKPSLQLNVIPTESNASTNAVNTIPSEKASLPTTPKSLDSSSTLKASVIEPRPDPSGRTSSSAPTACARTSAPVPISTPASVSHTPAGISNFSSKALVSPFATTEVDPRIPQGLKIKKSNVKHYIRAMALSRTSLPEKYTSKSKSSVKCSTSMVNKSSGSIIVAPSKLANNEGTKDTSSSKGKSTEIKADSISVIPQASFPDIQQLPITAKESGTSKQNAQSPQQSSSTGKRSSIPATSEFVSQRRKRCVNQANEHLRASEASGSPDRACSPPKASSNTSSRKPKQPPTFQGNLFSF